MAYFKSDEDMLKAFEDQLDILEPQDFIKICALYSRQGDEYEATRAAQIYTSIFESEMLTETAYTEACRAYMNGQFSTVIKNCTYALQLIPHFAKALALRASAYVKIGDMQRAIQDITEMQHIVDTENRRITNASNN